VLLEEDAGTAPAVVVGATLVVPGAMVTDGLVRVSVVVTVTGGAVVVSPGAVVVSTLVPGRVPLRPVSALPPPPPQAPSTSPATDASTKGGAIRINLAGAPRRSAALTAEAFYRTRPATPPRLDDP
jgi:hypothetical protein